MIRARNLLFLCLLTPIVLHAESKNPADYPLRIHILGKDQTTFYHHRYAEESKGEGRANIFENSEARGADFTFDCSEKLKASFGFETYPAKWKKPNQELTVLLPVFGKAGSYFTCNLKTDLKDFAYTMHQGKMVSEPVAEYKKWMIKHDYDPEHGKSTPNRPDAGDTPPASSSQE
jgi:hypothetical protein